jgi:hypothetical protein
MRQKPVYASIGGAEDEARAFLHAGRAAFPKHRTVMLADASHFLQEDAGEEIAREFRVFLAEAAGQA